MKLTGLSKQHTPRTARLRHEPHGQGLVELALVIPVLIMIAVGALDLGRVFFSVITVTNVAREGVRYLTLHPEDRYVDDTDPVCYDLDIDPDVIPVPKPAYYCTEIAARQEAEATLGGPLVVDPDQIEIQAVCLNDDDTDIGCDRSTEAFVTATYTFNPVTLLVIPEMFKDSDGNFTGLLITRTARMMVP